MRRTRLSRWLLLCGAWGAFAGCAHVHYHSKKPDADGRGHEALAAWSATERALWFNTSSETVRVTLQCGRTIPFQEREGGVFVLHDPTLWSGPRTIEGEEYCGQVVGVRTLDELATGDKLIVELWCEAVSDDEGFTLPAPSLPSGRHEFSTIERSDAAPTVAPCERPASPADAPHP